MSNLICKKCGLGRGQHMAFKQYCPMPSGGFSQTERFEMKVTSLSMDSEVAARLRGRSLDVIEKEVARRVLKNLETSLSCYDLSRPLSREDLIDALAQVKLGYGL